MKKAAIFLITLLAAVFSVVDVLMIIYVIYDKFFGYSLFLYWLGDGSRFVGFILYAIPATFAAIILSSISLSMLEKKEWTLDKKEKAFSLFLGALLAIVAISSVIDHYKKSVMKTRCVKIGTYSDPFNGKIDVCKKFKPVVIEKKIEAKDIKIKECFFGSGTVTDGDCEIIDGKKLKISITSCDEYASKRSVSCQSNIKFETDKGIVSAGDIFVPVYIEIPKVKIK